MGHSLENAGGDAGYYGTKVSSNRGSDDWRIQQCDPVQDSSWPNWRGGSKPSRQTPLRKQVHCSCQVRMEMNRDEERIKQEQDDDHDQNQVYVRSSKAMSLRMAAHTAKITWSVRVRIRATQGQCTDRMKKSATSEKAAQPEDESGVGEADGRADEHERQVV